MIRDKLQARIRSPFRAIANWTQRHRASIASHVILGLVAYVPLLRTAPGVVGADTKSYLYLDPGRLMTRASSLWDPGVGTGTVSHQIIGYLWPMGPYFWLAERLGLPVWVAQRLWLATIFFAAGAGVLFLLRTLDLRGPGPLVAAFAYMLSPYVLAYAARMSAMLLPWAGLPWMIALLARALRERSSEKNSDAPRRGGWRYPAIFALLVSTVGTINATSLAYAGIAVACWVPFAIWGRRETTPKRALATLVRIGVLTLTCQLWWLVALALGGQYGIPVLDVTETVETVAESSTATEVMRGLGNWFFYGHDSLGPWVEASVGYARTPWLMAVSFAIPLLALAASAVLRWSMRAYFVFLIFIGTVIAVGAYPYANPSPLGALLKISAQASSAGLALRNAQRAVPLVALGMACLLGGAISALAQRRRGLGLIAAAAITMLVVANFPPLWERTLIDRNISRPETVPGYWSDAIRYLDGRDHGTRVLEIPGTDFSAYRWGNTIDPITPGLMQRPYVAQELLLMGSVPSANLLRSLDRRMQEGIFEPVTLAPMARLLGVGDVVLRSDLQYERYRTPRPRMLAGLLNPPPPGLDSPVRFGAPIPNLPSDDLPLLDEISLGIPSEVEHPAPVAAFAVQNPVKIVRTAPKAGGLLVAGDGEGLVDASAEGILNGAELLRYSASLNRDEVADALADGATLVLTDSNRRRAQRFTLVRENYGYTEEASELPLIEDPNDARLALFPEAGDDAFTVSEHRGVRRIAATRYGSIASYTPENRAAQALDGNPWTSWRVGDFANPIGERLLVDLHRPITADHVTITQPIWGHRDRWMTKATLRFDDRDEIAVNLTDASRNVGGQVIAFPVRTFRSVELVIDETNIGPRARYDGVSPVGVAELGITSIDGTPVSANEIIRLPTDLLDKAGTASSARQLTIVLSRARANPAEPFRSDEEVMMARVFHLPTTRSFAIGGTARISAVTDDATVDRLLGLPDASRGGITARSSGRLPGDISKRAASAIDGDPTTFWSPGLLEQVGHWMEFFLPRAVTLDGLDLAVVADGRHSVPTRLRIEGDDGEVRMVDVPAVADQPLENATAAAPVHFKRMTTRGLKITIEAVRAVQTIDYYGRTPVTLPVGIAEVGIPRVVAPDLPVMLPAECHAGLLSIDGRPIGVRLVGTTEEAERRTGVRIETCTLPGKTGERAGGTKGRVAGGRETEVGPGEHVVQTLYGRETGIDLDRLVLTSPGVSASPPAIGPTSHVTHQGRSSLDVRIDPAAQPYWLVLGQSFNDGWRATVGGRSLGPPQLVDGMSAGWLVDPAVVGGGAISVSIQWTPQRLITTALRISMFGALICLILATIGPATARRIRRRKAQSETSNTTTSVAELERTSDLQPVLASPFVTQGHRPPVPALLAWPAGVGAVTGMVITPAAGALVGLVVLITLSVRQSRLLLTFGAIGSAALAAGYTLVNQARYDHPTGFGWSDYFHKVHAIAFIAIALLAADALVELIRHRSATTPHPDSPDRMGRT